MASKREEKYFDTMKEAAGYATEAAKYLCETLNNFDQKKLPEVRVKMHEIEHKGDTARHAMIKMLSKEFITPIEREDIMQISSAIDDVIDKIEDIIIRIDMYNISEMRPIALEMTETILNCTEALEGAFTEFQNYKKSKTLHSKLIDINNIEEKSDKLYEKSISELFRSSETALNIFAWEQIFFYMEAVCDACEDVSDIIENVVMKNS
jgi:predicted phosphate transport protein (TIGR00153 family)